MKAFAYRCFFVGLLLVAIAMGGIGLMIPVRFESVPRILIEEAGRDSSGSSDEAALYLDFGKPGPARLLLNASEALGDDVADLLDRADALEAQFPDYRLSGGADPFFDQFLKWIALNSENDFKVVNHVLIDAVHRQELLGYLQASSNQSVAALLATRELTRVTRFMPVRSASGAPLDTAVLTTALLVQSGHGKTNWVVEVTQLARDAVNGNDDAVEALEAVYLAVLGAGQRLNWLQLAEWVSVFEEVESFKQGSAWLREADSEMPLVYATLLLADDAQAALDYRATFKEEGWQDMLYSLRHGKGGLAYLFEKQRPLYETPDYLLAFERAAQARPTFVRFVFENPSAARGALFALFLMGGFLFSFAFKGLFGPLPTARSVDAPNRITQRFIGFVQHFAVGVLVLASLVLLNEPDLLEQKVSEPGKLLLEFELNPEGATIEENNMPDTSIDQITIIVLLVFLFVQLMIYALCLYKLSQIKNTETTAELKIQLLDNEDSLFDMGLYVGLSGTVISLLMLAMGIVQASLVAAYASTLFGIIFVALLKVLHLRPLKRKYIVEAAAEAEEE